MRVAQRFCDGRWPGAVMDYSVRRHIFSPVLQTTLFFCVAFSTRRRWCSTRTHLNGPPTGQEGSKGTPSGSRKIQIAVVGSGPSGCFVASHLTKKHASLHVDIFERLPVPFGLCRYGVAPDHPDVKNVEKNFMELFKSGRVTWIGNVTVGKDIPVEMLLQHYAAVVFATGAEESRKLGIPGEDLCGVISAKDFVSYYNTVPFPYGSPRFCPFDVGQARNVVIIGNGNVALDVSRVLAASYKYFCTSDMNCVAVKEMMKNRIREITLVGRRDVTKSAFTIAEFRELTTYQPSTVKVEVDPFDLEAALAAPSSTNPRAHKRLMELVHKFCVPPEHMATEQDEHTAATVGNTLIPLHEQRSAPPPTPEKAGRGSALDRGPCTIRFRYSLKPIRFLPSKTKRNSVGAVLFERSNAPEGIPESERYCVLPCDLVFTSIGYRAYSGTGLPVDEARGVMEHSRGRVKGMPRVYCAGWAKTGAKGVILHSTVDAQETVLSILDDLQNKVIPSEGVDGEVATLSAVSGSTRPTMFGKYGLVDYFVAKKLEPVSMAGLERIFYVEHQRGVDFGKRLEKTSSVRDMLDVALGGEVGKRANSRIRGITNSRPEALLYLKEILDDDTDLAPLAHFLAREMPHKLAEEHPPGRIDPAQL